MNQFKKTQVDNKRHTGNATQMIIIVVVVVVVFIISINTIIISIVIIIIIIIIIMTWCPYVVTDVNKILNMTYLRPYSGRRR